EAGHGDGGGGAEELVGGGPAGDQVTGVHVPALVVAAPQRAGDQPVVFAQRGGRVGLGHDLGGAVAHPHPGLGGRDLHDRLGMVGGGMVQRLVGGGDPAVGGVVVGAEMQGVEASDRKSVG